MSSVAIANWSRDTHIVYPEISIERVRDKETEEILRHDWKARVYWFESKPGANKVAAEGAGDEKTREEAIHSAIAWTNRQLGLNRFKKNYSKSEDNL